MPGIETKLVKDDGNILLLHYLSRLKTFLIFMYTYNNDVNYDDSILFSTNLA